MKRFIYIFVSTVVICSTLHLEAASQLKDARLSAGTDVRSARPQPDAREIKSLQADLAHKTDPLASEAQQEVWSEKVPGRFGGPLENTHSIQAF